MKIQAAVAWEADRPLEIEEVEIEGPREGECLVRIVASSVCHTDAYTLSGVDPEGLFPAILGHEGGAVVEEVGPGVRSLEVGDHVIPLYTPECRECKYCLSGKTNLCFKLRETQGQGLMPDRTSRLSKSGKKIHHYMGCSTFAQYAVIPEIALARIRKDAPLDKVCLLGCGVTTGIGAVLNTAKAEPGSTIGVFGLGGIGLSVVQGAIMSGAERIIGVDTNPKKFELARQFGATDFIDPSEVEDVAQAIVDMTDGGVDYSFDCTGNTEVMGDALRSAHRGWGESIIIGVAGAGQEIHARPFLLVTGRVWRGTAFGGVKGRTQVPKLVDQYMNGRVKLDEMVTSKLPLAEINTAFEQLHGGNVIRTVIEF
ncbi:MAG: S-(hydroxymethyl)glutathione dehydrogenase/class III alcohol dehydrogenase [bacterium]|nr:S-(hydroxymethyl)glutathione dehydrogenase/class III alcohol dehydrogenase [bacterium]